MQLNLDQYMSVDDAAKERGCPRVSVYGAIRCKALSARNYPFYVRKEYRRGDSYGDGSVSGLHLGLGLETA